MKQTRCRICESSSLASVLDLGTMPLANRFLRSDQLDASEPTFPLCLVLCTECGLVQLDETVDREVLFKDYIYVSGTSDLVHQHAAWLARSLTKRYDLGDDDLVMEAASNDGTVLDAFRWQGLRVLGIEPSENVSATAIERGIDTVVDFFDADVANRLAQERGRVRLFLARHVLAHVTDLHGFVQGIQEVLAPDGVGVVEVPHLGCLHDKLEFDTIYHEHLCYFSLHSLQTLFRRFGLEIIDAERVAMHGGSLLVHVARQDGTRVREVRPSATMSALLEQERRSKLGTVATWHTFAQQVRRLRESLPAFLDAQLERGMRLAGYGAPAKGNTLLCYCGIGPDRLPYIVDKSPHKQGLYTPGSRIPVVEPETLAQDVPDVTLILAWNFAEEIVHQQADYQAAGGRFALPLPTPSLIGGRSWSKVS